MPAVDFMIQIYFAVMIYSYAYHLRRGTYRSLPLTFANGGSGTSYGPIPVDVELEEEEDTRLPLESVYTRHTPHSSTASWTDFISAPGRKKRFSQREREDIVDEVLFDEDEIAGGGLSSSGHSKIGTEEASVGTNGDDVENARRR